MDPDVGDLTRVYSDRLDQLKRELEAASVAFDEECDVSRAPNANPAGLRPRAQAYEQALSRYRKFLLDGIVPSDNNQK